MKPRVPSTGCYRDHEERAAFTAQSNGDYLKSKFNYVETLFG